MKILLLLAIIGSSAFGSSADMVAKGQNGIFGSYYLMSDRNAFRSPNLLDEGSDRIWFESEKELGFKKGNFQVSVGETRPLQFIFDELLLPDLGFSFLLDGRNGEGVDVFGAVVGYRFVGVDLWAAFTDDKNANDKMEKITKSRFGMVLPFNDYRYTVFGEYKNFYKDESELILGLSYAKDWLFADLTGSVDLCDETKNDMLTGTVGGIAKLSETFEAKASASQQLYFGKETSVNFGLTAQFDRFAVGTAVKFDAFGKDSPAYRDFDVVASLSMGI